MVHKAKRGTKQVTLHLDPELRAELMRFSGATTLTEAIHEALADLVLRERAESGLRKRRALERQWVREKRLGLQIHSKTTSPFDTTRELHG